MPTMRTFGCLLAMLAGSLHWAQAQPLDPVVKRTYPFVNYTEIGALFGRVTYPVAVGSFIETTEKSFGLTMQTFNGVRLRPRLAVGGVIGVDMYAAALLLPVGAGVRYDLAQPSEKYVRVFASADVGYGLTWLDKASTGTELTRGGLMLNPGVGLRLGNPNKGAFVMSFSYKRQTAQAAKPLQWNDIRRDESRVYNRVAVRLGISF